MRKFMWSGSSVGHKYPVAWQDVCADWDQDGLNFSELLAWNKAAMATCLRDLLVQNSDSI